MDASTRFDNMYSKHSVRTRRIQASILRNTSMTDEAQQKMWVSVWTSCQTNQVPRNISAYLSVAARNAAFAVRLAKKKANEDQDHYPIVSLNSQQEDDSEEDGYRSNSVEPACDPYDPDPISPALKAALRKAVDMLPGKTREVIELHYFGNLPVQEIALHTGLTVSTVTCQLVKGRDMLRLLFTKGVARKAA